MARYGMVIDLRKCVGCGACAFACKAENNTPNRSKGQTFNWADFIYRQEGSFPNVKYAAIPVLCNHCSDAACVEVCPTNPKAMYKSKNGITLHNDDRCIGCRKCQKACPYSDFNVEKSGAAYSVISFNSKKEEVQAFYADTVEMIPGCTSSGQEMAQKSGRTLPYETVYEHEDYQSVRRKGVTEKCMLCAHRLDRSELPACVEACPAGARVVGDLDDAKSEAAKLVAKHEDFRLKEEAGTKPNVYYIRSFGVKG